MTLSTNWSMKMLCENNWQTSAQLPHCLQHGLRELYVMSGLEKGRSLSRPSGLLVMTILSLTKTKMAITDEFITAL